MHILFDSSVIRAANFGNSPLFRFILSTAPLVGHHLYVSELTIEEVGGIFQRELVAGITKVDNILQDISRQLSRTIDSPLAELDPESEANAFTEALRAQLSSSCTMLDYPSITHSDLVRRAVLRRRPFNEKGSGFRDALLWESLLSLLDSVNDRVLLLATDKDFVGKDDRLHTDLMADLRGRGHHESSAVDVVRELKAFSDQYIRQELDIVLEDDVQLTLARIGFDSEDSIALALQEEYAFVFPSDLGYDTEYDALGQGALVEVSDLTVVEIREVTLGHFLLQIDCVADYDFTSYMYISDAYALNLSIYHLDDDGFAITGTTLSAKCRVDISCRVSDPEQRIVQVLAVEPTAPTTDGAP